jgi:tRNA threonylcarbamoyladenosine biosynthesis protein TsaB
MGLILAIETSTKNCSVALFNKGELLNYKEEKKEEFIHSEKLVKFIEEVLQKEQAHIKDLDAIAVSKGPGSYTGLRIGTSTSKGLCYALDIPLISISTLKSMAFGMAKRYNFTFFCPMIDARRMEVYAAMFDDKNNLIREINADIVDKNTYKKFLNKKVVFFGDGALKCKPIISSNNAFFIDDIFPSSIYIGELAQIKFLNNEFEDVAYFEPYYLKEFLLGKKS